MDETLNDSVSLNLTASNGDPKRKKTLSRFTSVASVLSTPMAKAFKRSISNVRLPGSPAPSNPAQPGGSNRNSVDLNNTPSRFFMRSASSAKVLQQHNANTPESPLLKRGGVGRNSSTNLTPYK